MREKEKGKEKEGDDNLGEEEGEREIVIGSERERGGISSQSVNTRQGRPH